MIELDFWCMLGGESHRSLLSRQLSQSSSYVYVRTIPGDISYSPLYNSWVMGAHHWFSRMTCVPFGPKLTSSSSTDKTHSLPSKRKSDRSGAKEYLMVDQESNWWESCDYLNACNSKILPRPASFKNSILRKSLQALPTVLNHSSAWEPTKVWNTFSCVNEVWDNLSIQIS